MPIDYYCSKIAPLLNNRPCNAFSEPLCPYCSMSIDTQHQYLCWQFTVRAVFGSFAQNVECKNIHPVICNHCRVSFSSFRCMISTFHQISCARPWERVWHLIDTPWIVLQTLHFNPSTFYSFTIILFNRNHIVISLLRSKNSLTKDSLHTEASKAVCLPTPNLTGLHTISVIHSDAIVSHPAHLPHHHRVQLMCYGCRMLRGRRAHSGKNFVQLAITQLACLPLCNI